MNEHASAMIINARIKAQLAESDETLHKAAG